MMNWHKARELYPDKWLLCEAISSHDTDDMRCIIGELLPIRAYNELPQAWNHYSELQKEQPENDYYVYHTSNEDIVVKIQQWVGVRVAK